MTTKSRGQKWFFTPKGKLSFMSNLVIPTFLYENTELFFCQNCNFLKGRGLEISALDW